MKLEINKVKEEYEINIKTTNKEVMTTIINKVLETEKTETQPTTPTETPRKYKKRINTDFKELVNNQILPTFKDVVKEKEGLLFSGVINEIEKRMSITISATQRDYIRSRLAKDIKEGKLRIEHDNEHKRWVRFYNPY